MDLLLSLNSKMFVFALTLLYSIFKNNKKEHITIWLCYSDLTENEILILKKFITGFGGNLQLLYIGEELYRNLNTDYYAKEVYFRILAIELLPKEMDKILYLDVDMIVKGSLEALYHTDVSRFAFAACEDIYSKLIGTDYDDRKEKLKIPKEFCYINSGMILFNLRYFRETDAVRKLIDHIQNRMKDHAFPDQDALNVLFYPDILYVPWELYNCPPMMYVYQGKGEARQLMNYVDIDKMDVILIDDVLEIYRKAVIIHFAGTRRPWLEKPGEPDVVKIYGMCFEDALKGVHGILGNL